MSYRHHVKQPLCKAFRPPDSLSMYLLLVPFLATAFANLLEALEQVNPDPPGVASPTLSEQVAHVEEKETAKKSQSAFLLGRDLENPSHGICRDLERAQNTALLLLLDGGRLLLVAS
ncbi:unnamed protein product [Polarella glacialis]|uniref:Uncharacterized protein n=1 Tax=Polarella glacialis TaxID=89957 RepID=A0A813G4Q5_POLGL|nr:unnamed protein product [Polarella glacialis]